MAFSTDKTLKTLDLNSNRKFMKIHGGLISTADGIADLAAALKGQPIISFDTEFIRENTFYPIVEIIQVATETDSWLVDAQAFKRGFKQGPTGGYDHAIDPLLEIFKDKSILKVVHAAQGDQECLYTSYAMVAEPIIDTSVAASLCGYGDNIGLGKLLKSALDVTIKKGHARTNWSVRPLPEQLIEYAHADVEHLVELGKQLLAKLDEQGRKQWALELSAKYNEVALYEVDLEGMTQKLARGGRLDRKGYAALLELVKWRETRVRHLNLPRRWVADDAVLVDIAQVKPKTIDHLGSFRGLNKGELKSSGELILAALRKASEDDSQVTLPHFQRTESPSNEESQVLDLLKCYIGILADEHRIAAKHLSTVAQLVPLLRNKITSPEDLAKTGVLSGEATKLIGPDLIAFLEGKKALAVNGSKIEVIDIKK
jgi:ribonuclease D